MHIKGSDNSCKYTIVDGALVRYDKWRFDSALNKTAHVVLGQGSVTHTINYNNLVNRKISMTVFATEKKCDFDISFELVGDTSSVCYKGQLDMVEGVCKCNSLWTGRNCDFFSMKPGFLALMVIGLIALFVVITLSVTCFFMKKKSSNSYQLVSQ